MRYLAFLLLLLTIVSCNSNPVCDCAKAGENLNKYANKFLTEIPSQASKDSIVLLKKQREVICEDIKTLPTKKLEALSKDCAEF